MASRKKSKKAKPPEFNPSRLKQDVDTYTEGLYAVMGLTHHARWDEGTKSLRTDVRYGVGRRLTTRNSTPAAAAGIVVTPDLTIQLTSSVGIVAEAKPGVARQAAIWEENLRQLWKYNDDLHGWWTQNGNLGSHDVIALVPISRAVDFVDLLKQKIDAGEISFTRPLAVVAFFKMSGAEKTYLTLKTEHGTITDPTLRDRLRHGIPISWEHLLTHYQDKKFMDVEPPLPYTLWVLWDYLFSNMASGRETEVGQNWVAVNVQPEALTREIQQFYGFHSDGPHAVEIPRQKWIRRALDALVVFGMAKRKSEIDYTIKYRRHRTNGDTVAFFGRLCFRNENRLARAATRRPLLEMAEGTVPDSAADTTGN